MWRKLRPTRTRSTTLTITANENHLGQHACWSVVIGECRTALMDFGWAVWSAIVRTVISKPGNGQWSEVTVIRQIFMLYFYRAATTPAVSPMRMCHCAVVVSRLCVERGNSAEIYKTIHDGHNTVQYLYYWYYCRPRRDFSSAVRLDNDSTFKVVVTVICLPAMANLLEWPLLFSDINRIMPFLTFRGRSFSSFWQFGISASDRQIPRIFQVANIVHRVAILLVELTIFNIEPSLDFHSYVL